jgi:hypothetical protein
VRVLLASAAKVDPGIVAQPEFRGIEVWMLTGEDQRRREAAIGKGACDRS